MNSPSTALIWEIWRKNRWGFALLLVLFAVCAALTLSVGSLREKATILDQKFGDLSGSLSLSRVLSIPPTGAPVAVRVRLEAGVVQEVSILQSPWLAGSRGALVKRPFFTDYYGSVLPQDTFSWAWTRDGSWTPQFQLLLGTRKLIEGPVAPTATLSWPATNAAKLQNRALIPGLAEATATADAFKNSLPILVAMDWAEWGLGWSSVLLGFSVLAVFAIFAAAEPNATRGFTGIPSRRFALPVRTTTLVAWPILLGGATVLLLMFAWSRLVLQPLLPDGIALPEAYLTLLLLAGLAAFQAAVWGLPSFPKTRAVLIILLVLGLIPLAVLPFSMQGAGGGWPERWSSWQHNLTQLFAVGWVAGVAAAWFGVRQERRGGWAGWQRGSRIAGFVRTFSPRPLAFRSPLRAQFWIEWRRNCRVQLGVWILVVGIILGAAWLASSSQQQFFFSGVSDAIDFLKTAGLVVCVAIMGLNLARDGSSKRLALSSFTATRPIRTGDLLTAKLLAGLASWVLAVSVLGVAAVFVAAMAAPVSDQLWTELIRRQDVQTMVFFLAFALNVFVGILPLSLSGKFPAFPWSLLPLLLIYGVLLNCLGWFAQHYERFGQLSILLVVAAILILKLLLAVWGFRRALGLHLVSAGFVAGYVACWLLGTGALVAWAWIVLLRANWTAGSFLYLLAILVLPLARIAVSPLALAMNRHR